MSADLPNLRELDDPSFFTYWAAIRNQLALTPLRSPKHPEIKRRYEEAANEYRQRISGEPRSERQ
jgi:hypothetical protein